MVPIEERIGEWRFAGTAQDLAEAFERCGALINRVWPREAPRSGLDIIRDWFPSLEVSRRAKPGEFGLPREGEVVLFAQGAAPHDDIGLAIFEVSEWGVEDHAPSQ